MALMFEQAGNDLLKVPVPVAELHLAGGRRSCAALVLGVDLPFPNRRVHAGLRRQAGQELDQFSVAGAAIEGEIRPVRRGLARNWTPIGPQLPNPAVL